MTDVKICSCCKLPVPVSMFSPNKRCQLGVRNICRPCENSYKKTLRTKNIDAAREKERVKSRRLYRQLSPERKAQLSDKNDALHRKQHHKEKARWRLVWAVKTGKIQRKPCVRCGKEPSHGHHDDYSKALDVIWLCPLHHAERHRELKTEGRQP